jgi:acetyltransferase
MRKSARNGEEKMPDFRYNGMMSILNPRSVAVIGASATPGKVGNDILRNLLTQGFAGTVFAVNAKGGTIEGQTAYTSVKEIKEPIDLAVIATPAATVEELVEECATMKIPSVIVITAGFGETGKEEGKEAEKRIAAIAKRASITLIGVNCLGMLRPSIGLNASFAKALPMKGSIALVSQSGALAVGIMDGAPSRHLGFSLVMSLGNKTAFDECNVLRMCAEDPETRVIGLYLESIRDGRLFLAEASAIIGKKPVVLLKSGTTSAGRKAAASHTGALAGSDSAIDAICRQSGMHRAHSIEEFLDLLCILSTQPPLLTDQIAVITNAGGPGILAADTAEACGLKLTSLEKEHAAELHAALPPAASTANPIDVLGDADAPRFAAALAACGKDPNIDGIAVVATPQTMTPCMEIAKEVVAAHTRFALMPIVTAFVGGETVEPAIAHLAREGVPNFPSPERAIHALKSLRTPATMKTPEHPEIDEARALKAKYLIDDTKGLLDPDLAEKILTLYTLPTPAHAIAQSKEEARKIGKTLGFPLIAKVHSRDILHKTDIGGVRANLKSEEECAEAFEAIIAAVKEGAPNATIEGVMLQQFLPVGEEFIVGAIRDDAFGPLIMVGLGGIYAELFADVTFRLAPVSQEEAYRMLEDLRAWKLLLGMRGKPQSDIDALAGIIHRVSLLATECPQIRELDCNPVLVRAADATVVDAKIVVG